MTGLMLIVKDEEKLANLIADYCFHGGFQTHCIHHGNEVLPLLKEPQPVAIILDVMLPGMDGMEICKNIRTYSDVPVLMVTARVEEVDRLLGLKIGADNYICKPFSPREVFAWVKTILRRVNSNLLT